MSQVETRTFFPPFGVLGGPGEAPWTLAVGADPLDLTAHRGKDVLLIALPVNGNASVSLGLFGPFGEMDYPDGGQWGWAGTQATLYIAATTGRSSANNDVPAKTFVPGKLAPSLNYGQKLFDGADPLQRAGAAQGEILLTDPDGRLDYLLDYIWDGAPIIMKRGARGTPFSTWDTVGRYNAATIIGDVDFKRIALRDLGWQLQAPLHGEYYDGTGGLGGDAKLIGVWKPYGVGYVFNAQPALISAPFQIFQCSFAPAQSIFDVRHGGQSLDFWADYSAFEELRDAAIPSGWYGTCLAHTLVRPNIEITFGIRVDFCGDSSTAYGHPTPATRASIARRVATTYGPNRLNDATQIDVPSFTKVEERHPALCGWYWAQPVSKADVLTEIMGGILGYWKVRADGSLAIGYIDAPSRGSALNLAYRSFGMGKPRIVATMTPRAGTLMAWRRNYGPQGRSELADGVDDASAALYAQAARFAQSINPSVQRLYPTAQLVTVQGNFWDEAEAQVECSRQQGLLEIERKRWEWDMAVDPFIELTGTGVTLTGLQRLGAGDALPLICVEQDTKGTSRTTFGFWG
jgi:hypothetical protein